ncbi:DUF262 domain-containing HNH endonuclease family protein [Solirubrobacter taibaiensis]|nr:DUF262 domain-containing HNH endonuclease family protein [Solirubrobacter taibaiensis]
MDAGVHTITELLSAPGRLLVPVYQRPYVWTRDAQWEPLWNDILWLLDGFLEGKARRHFLGAIVLQQLPNLPGELPRREIIDGQQRLTTLQILLAACAASAGEMGAAGVQEVLGGFVRNSEYLAKGDDIYKLWPTENDRYAYRLVMTSGGPPADAPDDPSNSIQEAFDFFADSAKEFAISGGVDSAAITSRFEALLSVLMQQLHVVSINLQQGDDAQVIFETLNARGTPLLEMDNVKNALFHRASQQGHDVQALNDDVWQPELGDVYWRDEVRQGRLVRPRAELFLNHWLTMVSRDTVMATKLFQAFRGRVLDESPATDAAVLTRELCRDAAIMRGFDHFEPTSANGRFFRALEGVDTTTVLPLTLLLFRNEELDHARRERALVALESYLVRRMLLASTTKAYNRLFVDVLGPVAAQPDVADDIVLGALASSSAASALWPSDDQLRKHLLRHPLYGYIARSRVEYLLWEIELVLRDSSKTEPIVAKPKKLSIEHVLPQTWEETWPLNEPTEEGLETRSSVINVLGNLTLVTGELNSAMSNAPWVIKRQRLEKSILLLNSQIKPIAEWGEQAILDRGDGLIDLILKRWPGPSTMIPGFDPLAVKPVVAEVNAELAELTAEQLIAVLDHTFELMRTLLVDLAANPGRRRRFIEIEDALGWSRGRLASVLGGFAVFSKAKIEGKRPYRIGKDEDGSWWMWMDDARAETTSAHLVLSA